MTGFTRACGVKKINQSEQTTQSRHGTLHRASVDSRRFPEGTVPPQQPLLPFVQPSRSTQSGKVAQNPSIMWRRQTQKVVANLPRWRPEKGRNTRTFFWNPCIKPPTIAKQSTGRWVFVGGGDMRIFGMAVVRRPGDFSRRKS